MSQQERIEHREAIASDVEAVLDFYWKERPPPIIKAKTLVHWCDELQDWTQEQVVWALRQWNRDNPDKRPTPGHILGIMTAMRGKREAARIFRRNSYLFHQRWNDKIVIDEPRMVYVNY